VVSFYLICCDHNTRAKKVPYCTGYHSMYREPHGFGVHPLLMVKFDNEANVKSPMLSVRTPPVLPAHRADWSPPIQAALHL
jgi:hypothetical protein